MTGGGVVWFWRKKKAYLPKGSAAHCQQATVKRSGKVIAIVRGRGTKGGGAYKVVVAPRETVGSSGQIRP